MFIIAIGDCPHVSASVGMNRTGVLTLDLLPPVLVIRYPDSVAWFVHGSRLEYTNRESYAQKRQLAVTKVTVRRILGSSSPIRGHWQGIRLPLLARNRDSWRTAASSVPQESPLYLQYLEIQLFRFRVLSA
jgi:hypothetical protein